MGHEAVLDEVIGNRRWTTVDPTPATAKQHSKRVAALASIAGSALAGLSVDAKDDRADRTTVVTLGDACVVVEGEKDDGIDDAVIEGLNGVLKAVGAAGRFGWAPRAEGALACITASEADALRKRGLSVEILGDGDDEGDDGALTGWRRPTRADIPGGASGSPVRVDGRDAVGPVRSGGAVEVTFDAAGNVDQIRAKKGPLSIDVRLAGEPVTILVKGRAECSPTGWRAWGELAKDLSWSNGSLHAGDEIDIADGEVAGVVLASPGVVGGKPRKAGAVVDVPRG